MVLDGLALVGALLCIFFLVRSLVFAMWFREKETSVQGALSQARNWLEDNGYSVLKVKGAARYTTEVDDLCMEYSENAPLIARKDGHEYAVLVEHDEMPHELIHQRYFPLSTILGVRGVIVVDVVKERVRHVEFRVMKSRRYYIRQCVRNGVWFAGGALFVFGWLHRV